MLAGLAAAPLAAALIAVGTYDLSWHAGLIPHGIAPHSLDAAAPLFLGLFILAVVVTGIAAVPGVIWLNQRRWLSLASLLVLGAVVGHLPFALIVVGILVANLGALSRDAAANWYGLSGALVRIAMGTVAGAGGAATFWLMSACGTRGGTGRSSLPLGT
jgi:hypothetical protein